MPIDTHHLPPDFAGKLRAIAPSLCVFLTGMFCFSWALVLYKGWEQRIEARKAAEEGKQASSQPTVSKQTRTILVTCYFLAGTVLMGFRYINILWPTHSWAIEKCALFVFVAIVIAGMLLQHRGQRTLIGRRDDDFGRKREPIAINTTTIVATTIVLAAAAGWAVYKASKMLAPSHEGAVFGIGIAIVASAFGFVFEMLKKNRQDQDSGNVQAMTADAEAKKISRRKTRNIAVLMAFEAVILGVLSISMRPGIKEAVFYGQFALLFVGAVAIAQLKRKVYFLSKSGEFDRALRLNRMMLKVPGYGNSFEGIILFNAGRYSEACACLKPLAFDSNGKPKLASTDLYCYAIAMENDGHVQEAEELLRAAVDASANEGTHKDALKVALATCLLEQEKEAARACGLLEQAMATRRESGSSYGSRADDAHRIARYAWALASAGRRADAERTIQQAIDLSKGLKDYDVAGTQYFSGEAWRMLGDRAKARSTFEEALKLCPQGVIALSVKKAQAKLNNGWRV
jgi:tetratricopeptide (TPR) repeat protein